MGLHHYAAILYVATLLSTARAQTDCTVQKDLQGNAFGYCTSTNNPSTGQSYASATAPAVSSKSNAQPLGARGAAGVPSSSDGVQGAASAPLPPGVDLNRPYIPIDGPGFCSSCGTGSCGETCTWSQFYWVYYLGLWRPIYHYGTFVQYIKTCQCSNPNSWCFSSQGLCTNKYTEVSILIWWNFTPRWVYVTLPMGCCCAPWRIGPHRDPNDRVPAGPVGSTGVAGAV